MRRRDAAERNGSWCRAATDSDAQAFETGRFRNAFASGIPYSSGMGAGRVKDQRDQRVGRFPSETNAGQTTYIANRCSQASDADRCSGLADSCAPVPIREFIDARFRPPLAMNLPPEHSLRRSAQRPAKCEEALCTHVSILRGRKAGPYPGRIVFFRPRRSWIQLVGRTRTGMSRHKISGDGLDVHRVPGAHNEMLRGRQG